MKLRNLFTIFILAGSISATAQAESNIGRPYMNDWQNAYDSHWENRNWQPADWVGDGQTVQDVINGFYNAGIVTDQYYDDDMPVLEVGQGFLELSGRDQRRVTDFIAYAFNIRGKKGDGVMQVVLKRQETPLGVYSRGMLQLH